ncbi:hypothetical protein ACFSTC_25385 [Nonomuraea ferruginea]
MNGGWLSGLLAGELGATGPVEVTLRAPAPVETPLRVAHAPDGLGLFAGDRLLAEARPAAGDPVPPPAVSLRAAAEAERRFPGHRSHPFPGCFVCGLREDGLRVHPGPTADPEIFAATWFADPELTGGQEVLPPASVWAALDCPTGWTHLAPGGAALLGRMTARLRRPVRARRHVRGRRPPRRQGAPQAVRLRRAVRAGRHSGGRLPHDVGRDPGGPRREPGHGNRRGPGTAGAHPRRRHRRGRGPRRPVRAAPHHLRRLHRLRAVPGLHRGLHQGPGAAALRQHAHRELRHRPADHPAAGGGPADHPRRRGRRARTTWSCSAAPARPGPPTSSSPSWSCATAPPARAA